MKAFIGMICGLALASQMAQAYTPAVAMVNASRIDSAAGQKERILKKSTESVTECVGTYYSNHKYWMFEFTVVSRVLMQKWLESKGEVVPGSVEKFEMLSTEPILQRVAITFDHGAGPVESEALEYCKKVVQSPFTELIEQAK